MQCTMFLEIPNLLGEIVVDDDGVLAVVTEVLSHGYCRSVSMLTEGTKLFV